MPSPISFELVTPAGLSFSADVWEVLLPTAAGQIGILPDHRPLITLVVPGVITLQRHEQAAPHDREYIATAGGFAAISGRRVRLLADRAERADEIDELAAQEALHRAQALRKNAKDQVSLADALSLIEHHAARLKVAELRRRHRR
jgi:F-type H+-transporting ATPase subunit epsilon